jgi:RimJ/RimL family protein N-acetyltransferase
LRGIPDNILKEAIADPKLFGEIPDRKLVPILHEDKIVGFYAPKKSMYRGVAYHRTGAIFVSPKFRNLGLGSKAVLDFFSNKKNGLAYIEPNNPASMSIFGKAGFKKDGEFIDEDGTLYNIMKKRTVSNKYLKKVDQIKGSDWFKKLKD